MWGNCFDGGTTPGLASRSCDIRGSASGGSSQRVEHWPEVIMAIEGRGRPAPVTVPAPTPRFGIPATDVSRCGLDNSGGHRCERLAARRLRPTLTSRRVAGVHLGCVRLGVNCLPPPFTLRCVTHEHLVRRSLNDETLSVRLGRSSTSWCFRQGWPCDPQATCLVPRAVTPESTLWRVGRSRPYRAPVCIDV